MQLGKKNSLVFRKFTKTFLNFNPLAERNTSQDVSLPKRISFEIIDYVRHYYFTSKWKLISVKVYGAGRLLFDFVWINSYVCPQTNNSHLINSTREASNIIHPPPFFLYLKEWTRSAIFHLKLETLLKNIPIFSEGCYTRGVTRNDFIWYDKVVYAWRNVEEYVYNLNKRNQPSPV